MSNFEIIAWGIVVSIFLYNNFFKIIPDKLQEQRIHDLNEDIEKLKGMAKSAAINFEALEEHINEKDIIIKDLKRDNHMLVDEVGILTKAIIKQDQMVKDVKLKYGPQVPLESN